ncbi:DUF1622 domain-containing protein [Streptomyces sp. NBC_00154]|uniref:DUF1622 domain-containing protein n=1 Tax=Streptomyces sp. NBC_00154 TaxID=2975670 RepID=UPI0022539A3C|nr:DUF1622 domain-containing protein [Streptomyces sp. NBC_00154]MCX5315058.1 DUF1622 domain-containing protein [Streptomyces sp. NBC_00154]
MRTTNERIRVGARGDTVEFQHIVELVGRAVDAVGVAIIVVGTLLATVLAAIRLSRRQAGVYRGYRRRVGRSILLGLEFLVAGDIIRTVAVAPTYASVGVLAVIVGIRTFLSFSLELEITGRWPWQKPVAEAED